MRTPWRILPAACACALAAHAQEKPNAPALVLQDFNQRVAGYVKLHKMARAEVHGLKPTESAEAIEHHEHELAHRIREARSGVAQGNIFTPGIAAEFHRLLAIALQGPDAASIRESLRSAAPLRTRPLHVNGAYPVSLPLQSTPPSLLLNLPPLPKELEYRIVGRDLVLHDIEANLIVDFIHNAMT